jgi:hypothetical protein
LPLKRLSDQASNFHQQQQQHQQNQHLRQQQSLPVDFNIYKKAMPQSTTSGNSNGNNLQIMNANGLSNSTNLLVGSYHSVSDISVLSDADNDEPISSGKAYINYQQQQQHHYSGNESSSSSSHGSSSKSCSKAKTQTSQSDEFEFLKPRDPAAPMSLSFEKLDLKQVSFGYKLVEFGKTGNPNKKVGNQNKKSF